MRSVHDWIYDKLSARLFFERHKVTQLKWEKAELEHKIALAKREKCAMDEGIRAE